MYPVQSDAMRMHVYWGPSPALQFAGQRVERVRADCGGPDGRHATFSCPTSKHCLGSAGAKSVAGRELFERSAGLPCGISLQLYPGAYNTPEAVGIGMLG